MGAVPGEFATLFELKRNSGRRVGLSSTPQIYSLWPLCLCGKGFDNGELGMLPRKLLGELK
jgi:hypothetical protein